MVALPTWTITVTVAAMVVIPALLPEETFRKWFETPWQTQRRLDLKWKIQPALGQQVP